MAHKVYSLLDGGVISRDATPDELADAAAKAKLKLDNAPGGWAVRSCWNCNPAHSHFLEDTSDDFLFSCVMGCGHWYFNGVDLTGDE